MRKSILSAVQIVTAMIAVTLAPQAFGTANYVYHERTANDATGGNASTCGGPQVYLPLANPSSVQSNFLRFKVEFQFFTDSATVYYTTDGTSPSGAKGVASGTTVATNAAFQCTFSQGADTVDIWNATIPALPAGTVVKYIIGAWHSGGGDEIFANSGTCGGCGNFNSSSLATVFQYTVGSTTDLYWDSNGATAGAGATPTGTWGTDSFWSSVLDGTAATTAWTSGRTAVFSAGGDATGPVTVTVSGTQTAGGIRVEEGTITLATGTANVGAGNVTVESGATLSADSSLRIGATAGSTITLNGGTVRATNPNNAGSFVDVDFVINLGAAGGTFAQTVTNINTIVQGTTTIAGPGSFTKTGIGVLAIASACTYSGSTIINDGEVRIRTSANRLPVTTPVIVNAPGILNLNSVGQQIGSLSGNGDVGLGTATLIVGDATSTTYSGALKNVANYGASAVGSGAGRVVKTGSGTLILAGINSYTGSLTVSNGAVTVAPGAVLCDPIADIILQGGSLNLDNAAQTILSLQGNGGTLNLGTGHTLTVNPSNTRTNAGTIAGAGALNKTGTGTLVLSGANTYAGGTTIAAGSIRAGNSSGSATGSGNVDVQAAGTLSGNGTVAGAVNVSGTISAGASPGTLNTGSETWNGGGTNVWEINDVDAGAGTNPGWDLVNITGGLTIAATPSSKFTIKITSLALNVAGNVADFDNTLDYAWTILKTTTGITGFDPAAINLDASGFSNPVGSGVFRLELANGGNDLVLHFVHPAAIAAGPVGGSAECASDFVFTVTGAGTPPLAYQWKHAGTNLPGANSSSLTVAANAQTAGNYSVEVSNAYGTAASGTAALASVDTTPPTINCGQNETLNCGLGWDFTVPIVSDTCDGNNVTLTIVSTMTNAACGNTFTATRIWQATDQSANSTTCTQIVTIVDATAPMITCAPNATAPCNAPISFTAPTATDGCGGDVTITVVSTVTNVIAGGYTVTRTWQAADACSNVATCSQTITVPEGPTVAVNSATICGDGSATLTATTTASNPGYSWSPGGETTASITVSPASTTTYTCTVTDGNNGCTAAASGTVKVRAFENFANSAPITINDNAGASPYPSTISISTLTATVCRVTVSLHGLTHAYPDDLDIVLVGPNGQGVYLMSDVGGGDPLNGVNLTFNDNAAAGLPDAIQIISGSFKCSNVDARPDSFLSPAPASGYSTNLAAFSGINPNGDWKLFVLDDELIDAGQIAGGWSMEISTLNPIADVGISQVDIPDPVAVGSNLTYTVTVTNNGLSVATGVLASDTPPAGATLVSFTSSQGSCTVVSGTIWCTLGSLAPNATAIVTVVVTPTASGTLVNTASVQADEVDFVSANNSSTASSTVLNPPAITTGPASQVVCAGTDVTFTVVATGDAPLSYQWYQGVNPISGANGASLTLTGAQPSASGGYSVVVNNAVGAASASATLTVNAPPTVSVASTTICAPASATLTAVNNASNPTYLWTPGGSTNASITVSPTSTTTYSVTVTDGATTCSSSASGTVTVNQSTTATALTSVTNACPGTSVSFATTAAGTGPHSYVWRKNGTVITGQNGPSLTLPSVASGDAGTYCVEVAGLCNSVTNCATLSVTAPPAITSQPQNQITPMGNTATFSVTVSGTALTSYQWKQNGVDLPGATASSLTIGPATLAQNGNTYSVTVSNCAGTLVSSTATLNVTPVSGISFDFDTPNQFTNTPYFTLLNDWLATRTDAGLPTVLLESPIGGVNGSGAVDVTGTVDLSMILHPASYDFSLDGKTLVASTMVRIVAPTQNNRNTQLGFVTATNVYNGALAVGVNDNNPQGFMTVILQSTAQPALTYQLRLQHRRTDGAVTEVTPTPTPQATLTAGNWYKLVATFQNIKGTAANTFSVAGSLQDMGANGLTPGAVVMSYTPTNVVNTSLPNQKNMFLAIRSSRSDTGADFWDNVHAYTATGPVFFVTPPETQTVKEGRQATFTARVDGTGPYSYQWNKNGSPIAGARNWKYITQPVRPTESGDQYTVTVTGPANTVTSDPAILTVTSDSLAVVSVGSVDGGSIGVQFNEPVDKATAENPANYLVNGTPATAARVFASITDSNNSRVIITPAAYLTGPYTVTVQNVLTLAGTSLGANNSANGRVEGLAGIDVNPLIVQPAGIQNSFGPGQFEITGSGTDIFSSPDGFRYVYKQVTGDFDVKVRVPYQDVIRAPSKSGFDARVSLDPTAPQVLAAVNPKWPARMQYEGTFRQLYGVGGSSYGNNPRVVYPDAWIRFRRVGNTFMRYSSVNGTTWQFDGQVAPTPAFPDSILLGLAVCPGANVNPLTAVFDGYDAFAGYPGATIAISTQPVGTANVTAGSSTNLSVVATITGAPAAGELAYVWQRNAGGGVWTNVPSAGQTNNTFAAGPMLASDNGAQYRVIVKAPGAADVISTTTTVVVTDAAAPTITAATIPVGANAQVLITYSEPMGASAVNAANYVVTNTVGGASLGVSSAAFLGLDTRTVILTTTSPLNAGSYGLRVTGVQDLGGNNLNPNPTLRSLSQAATAPAIGPVVAEFYGYMTNSPGIGDLTNNNVAVFNSPSAKFAADTPDFVVYSNVFGINPTAGNFASTLDHYGVQMYSYFVPPTNGAYKFFFRCDDFGEFYMNTNAVGSTNPAGAALQINITANQQAYTVANSVTNTLVAGQRYYMEVRFKESTGGDGATVAVRNDNTLPGQGEVIPASLLEFPVTITKPTPAVVELYTGLVTLNSAAGNDIGAAFGNGGYPDFLAAINSSQVIARNPNIIGYARYLGYNTNLAQVNATLDNYFGRLYANFIAPSTGLFKFWVRADDSCELWMNTNAVNSTDPAGASLLGTVNDFYNANYRLLAQNVSLTAGQRYYIEGRWREGTGGDGMTITFRPQSDNAVPPVTEVITGDRLEFPANFDRVGAVDAQMSPLSPVASDGQTITFQTVGLRGSPAYGVSWFKNGVQVAANALTFVTQPLGSSDNGAVITMVATNPFSRVERSTTITVLGDNSAPTIASAVGSQFQDFVTITFNEPLDTLTAGSAANYQVNNGLGVYSATLDPDSRRRVTLRTTPQTPGTTYTITVNNVRDRSTSGNAIAPNTQVAFTAWIAGGKGFYVELFTNIAGTAVANLKDDPKYINNWPDIAYYTNRLGASWFANDSGLNNYAARVTGLLSVPTNGLYRLYVRGDDGTQIFMNTNGPSPAGRVMVARNDGANSSAWDNGTGGSATPILTLSAGTLYFTEVFMKEGGGGDHLEVMLRAIDPISLTPVGGLPAPSVNDIVQGDFFVTVGNPDRAQLTVTQSPAASINVAQNDTVTLKAFGYAGNFEISQATGYRWQVSDGIGGYLNIPGAWGPTHTFVAPATDTEYRVIIGGPGTNAVYTTVVHSSSDNKAPFMISASSLNGTNLDVLFNEPLEATSAVDPFNYTINDGAVNIVAIVQRDDPRKITITVDQPVGATFTILAGGIGDLAGNFDVSTVEGRVSSGFVALDVGGPVALGSTFNVAEGEFDLVGGGNDIWGNADVGHIALTPVTGDFDVHLRVAGLTRPDPISKAGLMVRESLDANSRVVHNQVNPAQYQQAHPMNTGILTGRDLGEAGIRFATSFGTVGWQTRPESTGPPSLLGNSSYSPAGVPNAWVRIKRQGNLFSAFRSYDGVNWSMHAQIPFPMDRTVYVGMCANAHTAAQAVNLVTVANFRDVYIPPAPVILQQPSPSLQTVPLHAIVSYSVVASNPPPNVTALNYQWFRNGVAIPGATGTTLTINDAQPGNAGVYTVEVNNDGGTATSIPVTLNVDSGLVAGADTLNTVQNQSLTINASTLLANDSAAAGDTASIVAVSGVFPVSYNANFDAGLPAGGTIFGNATIEAAGGANNSGNARLNPGAGNQSGSFILNDLSPNRRVTAFNASFKLRIGNGSGQPADGFSFNFARDLPIAASGAAENGLGTGFSFCLDNYQFMPYPVGGIANSSGMKIRYNNLDIIGVRTPTWNTPRWVDVNISITPQGSMTVLVDGTNVFGTLTLPNYTPTTGRFGWYGRTGGEFQSHAIDDVSISALTTIETTREPAVNVTGTRVLGSAAISGGILRLTEAVNTVNGSYIVQELTPGSPVTSFNASFLLRIGNGSAEPADGFSFNFANDLPISDTTPAAAENGGGTGFSFCVDNYRFAPYPAGGNATTSGLKIRYGGIDIAGVQTATWNTTRSVPVSLSIDTGGNLTVLVDGTNVFGAVALPWTPTAGRFGLYARTGGQNETHWVDDLLINVTTAGSPASFANDFSTAPATAYGTVFLNGGSITYNPPADVCGSDTFYYLISGQNGGSAIGRVDVNIAEAIPTAPTITACATNRTIAAGLNCVASLPDMTGEVRATDNCCCVSVTQNPPAGTLLPKGVHTVTFTATDTAGLTAQCQATITVADQSAPVIALIGSGPVTIECHSSSAIPGATASDDCDGDITAQIIVGGSVNRNLPGSYTLTYNVSDSSGNAAVEMQRIVNVVDTSAPSIICPANIVTACEGSGGSVVTFSPSASDVCDASPSVVCVPASGSTFPAGVTTVNCVVTDASGNTNRCSFTVTVNDSPALLSIVQVSPTSVRISWPQTCGTFTLQQNDNLANASGWVPASETPVLASGTWTVTINTTTTRFYRLQSNP